MEDAWQRPAECGCKKKVRGTTNTIRISHRTYQQSILLPRNAAQPRQQRLTEQYICPGNKAGPPEEKWEYVVTPGYRPMEDGEPA